MLLALVEETPDMTLAEIAAHLESAHGLRVCERIAYLAKTGHGRWHRGLL